MKVKVVLEPQEEGGYKEYRQKASPFRAGMHV